MYPRFYRRAFLIATVAILGYLLLQLLRPLWAPFGWAAILTFLLYPLHKRLTRKFNGRAGTSAGVLTALTPFGIIAPVVIFATIFARQVGTLIDYLRDQRMTSYPGILAQVESYPVIGRLIAWLRTTLPVSAEQVEAWVTSGAQSLLKSAATMSGTVALGVVGTLIGFFLMLFLLFFLLRDGRSMLMHTMNLVPMAKSQRDKLMTYLSDVMSAVIYGHALTALIQGTLVGIGFAIAGLPSPMVFAVFAAIAAFIPAAGTGLVLVPAVIYLALAGRWGAAIFLGLWSVGVGVSDNFLRPYLTQRRAEVSTLTVFVGVIGGVSAFGFIGSLIGPVLLALIVALLRFAEDSITKKD
jgi:predicted PurR-regulated permease PerM